MSMVPDFQLADDGKWYEHAIIGEPKLWFVCFDDENPPELVIRLMRKPGNGDKMTAYLSPDELIRQFLLPLGLVSRNSNHDCLFPDREGRWRGKMLQATSHTVKMTGVIPAKLIISFRESFDRKPDVEGVYYDGAC